MKINKKLKRYKINLNKLMRIIRHKIIKISGMMNLVKKIIIKLLSCIQKQYNQIVVKQFTMEIEHKLIQILKNTKSLSKILNPQLN